ncbi:MAG: sulfatase-like hydrolase/transferase [Abditibacteriales bacterium]|nr:sulfatase-like hydrolase/transferase [Abditibacteriales bacterium]MDW8367252.1 sulfatase [Abditibacteriales bacterium]
MMNLLVLCTDTFRADYLGCYGNDWIQTPYLDRLAAEGVRFNDFYGEGLPTLPARRVFYTGRRIFPFRYVPQKSDQVQLPGWHPLFDEDITLAEWLSERGYVTGLISDLYHMMKPGKNFHRGFQSWQWIRGQETDPLVPTRADDLDLSRYLRPETPPDAPVRRMTAQYLNNRAWWKSEADHYAAQVMRAAADWMKNYGHKKPWMLWVESFDPHEPWDAPAEFVDKYCPHYDGRELIWAPAFTRDCTPEEFARIKAHYAGECSHVDKWCGYVLDTLDATGLRDDTLVVFTSDHGCMMGEQGEIHKGTDRVRIQVSRCPLLIRHPDAAFAGKVVNGFIQHHDLMPTLLTLLGEPVPARCNGENFWTLVTGERSGGLRDTVITAFGWYASVRTKDWNYHTAWATPPHGRVRPPELYDRRADPEELVNVIDQHPDVARELQARLDEVLRDRTTLGSMGDAETPAAVPGVKW